MINLKKKIKDLFAGFSRLEIAVFLVIAVLIMGVTVTSTIYNQKSILEKLGFLKGTAALYQFGTDKFDASDADTIGVVDGQITTCSIEYTFKNPDLTITSISPALVTEGDPSVVLTVNGAGFMFDSVVRFNGSDKQTTYVSQTQLTAVIPASDLTVSGTFDMAVFNQTFNAGISNSVPFVVNPASDSDGNYVYVVNETTNTLQQFNSSNLGLVKEVSTSDSPRSVTVSPDGNYAYVVNAIGNTLQKFNSTNLILAKQVATDSSPYSVAISPDGNYAYVVNYSSSVLQKFNSADLSLAEQVATDSGPYSVAVSPDGNFVYVVNSASSTLQKFNSSDLSLARQVGIGRLPVSVAISPNGSYIYVVNYDYKTLQKFNSSDLSLAKQTSIGPNSHSVAVSPNGNYIYVASAIGNTLQKFNSSDLSLAKQTSGGASPYAIAVSSDENYVYVVNYGGNTLQKFNSSDLSLAKQVATGSRPFSVAVSPSLVSVNPDNPVPTTTSISPTSATEGQANIVQFTLTVNGTNFIPASVVKFSNSNRTTTYVSPTQLKAKLTTSDLATAGTYNVTVVNPAPGGGESNPQTFTVNPVNLVKKANLVIIENATGGNATFEYIITGPVSLAVDITTVGGNGFNTLTDINPGTTYAIMQTVLSGWKLDFAFCDESYISETNGVTNVVVREGQTTTCTFSNIKSTDVAVDDAETKGVEVPGVENIAMTTMTTIGGIAQDAIATAKEITKSIKVATADLEKIIETPVASIATKVVSTVGVATGMSAIVPIIASTFSEIPLLMFRFLGTLLTAFGIRKKILSWGVAYDSVTKQPLDPAYIMLKDLKGKTIASAITDLDGRYGFLVEPGFYHILARKTNYAFPSKKLTGKTSDEIYNNLYFGEPIEIKKIGEVITKNIPLDPMAFDWNEFTKKTKNLLKFYSRWNLVLIKIPDILFAMGFIVALVTFFSAPHLYAVIILVLYLVLLLLRILGPASKSFGYIVDKTTGRPLSFAILRIMMPSSGVEISRKVADMYGRYYCLLPRGKYYVKIEKKNNDGSYSLVHTSSMIDVSKKGIIKKKFEI